MYSGQSTPVSRDAWRPHFFMLVTLSACFIADLMCCDSFRRSLRRAGSPADPLLAAVHLDAAGLSVSAAAPAGGVMSWGPRGASTASVGPMPLAHPQQRAELPPSSSHIPRSTGFSTDACSPSRQHGCQGPYQHLVEHHARGAARRPRPPAPIVASSLHLPYWQVV